MVKSIVGFDTEINFQKAFKVKKIVYLEINLIKRQKEKITSKCAILKAMFGCLLEFSCICAIFENWFLCRSIFLQRQEPCGRIQYVNDGKT